MILKIKADHPDSGWWFYDNIHRVKTGEITKAQYDGSTEFYDFVTGYDRVSSDGGTFRYLGVLFRDGNEKAFAVNTRTYLMSDDGKTIERLA